MSGFEVALIVVALYAGNAMVELVRGYYDRGH